MINSNTDEGWEIETRASEDQVAFYKENGYLTFGRIFTKLELDDLRDYVAEMIAVLPDGKRPEQMDVPHFEHPFLFKYLAHPNVLDVIERFIGPDIALWSSHFISKPTGDGLAVPWHQDGVYWGTILEPMHVITMWLAVDESTVENGCMRVIPGSHRLRNLYYENVKDPEKNLFNREVIAEEVDESQRVDLELKVGECHFHEAFTLHNSSPNTSQKRRCGYTMRYMPTSCHFHGVTWKRKHHIYLLRGEDRTDGFNMYTPLPTF